MSLVHRLRFNAEGPQKLLMLEAAKEIERLQELDLRRQLQDAVRYGQEAEAKRLTRILFRAHDETFHHQVLGIDSDSPGLPETAGAGEK